MMGFMGKGLQMFNIFGALSNKEKEKKKPKNTNINI